MRQRLPLVLLAVLAVTLSTAGPALGQTAGPTPLPPPAPDDKGDPPPLFTFDQYPPSANDNLVLQWDEELLQAVRAMPPGPTVVARAISVVHTAIFDAWAAYNSKATGTRLGSTLRRPPREFTLANKNKAISYAAYTALVDLFPARKFDFDEQMAYLRYNPAETDSTPGVIDSPAEVGYAAANAVLSYRHGDGSNQLNGYADTTGYQPVNSWNQLVNPDHWQPLCVPLPPPDATDCLTQQLASTPQWGNVKSFALTSPIQFMPPGPDKLADGTYDPKDIDAELALTSNLTDRQKVTAEFWADGPKSEFPPGHWALIAQVLSRIRHNSLDYDVQMFFALGNALLDASIDAWATKFKWDYVRPITAIRNRYKGKTVTSWLGPYQGYAPVPGETWLPYQSPKVVTPPFPEYPSGHSTFSSAAATVLSLFTGSDTFNAYVTIKAGTSLFEPKTDSYAGTPATDVVLSWPTLTAAAKDAGLSRRLGGIHFKDADEDGYAIGRSVGANVLVKTFQYINGPPSG